MLTARGSSAVQGFSFHLSLFLSVSPSVSLSVSLSVSPLFPSLFLPLWSSPRHLASVSVLVRDCFRFAVPFVSVRFFLIVSVCLRPVLVLSYVSCFVLFLVCVVLRVVLPCALLCCAVGVGCCVRHLPCAAHALLTMCKILEFHVCVPCFFVCCACGVCTLRWHQNGVFMNKILP